MRSRGEKGRNATSCDPDHFNSQSSAVAVQHSETCACTARLSRALPPKKTRPPPPSPHSSTAMDEAWSADGPTVLKWTDAKTTVVSLLKPPLTFRAEFRMYAPTFFFFFFLSCKEEYEPWKWGAIARYYTSHTKTMLATRKSVPRSSRQSDHTKTSWPS